MPGDALVRHVVTFGRVLHEAGLEVGPGRVLTGLARKCRPDVTTELAPVPA